MENQATKPEGSDLVPETPRARLLLDARQTSSAPGCYLMKDDQGHVLYVGKAKNLKNRLASYFQAPPHEVTRTEMLVNRIRSFEVILTETESEALILEATLVKKHKPKFNVRLKDDKTYPYLKIDFSQAFPRIEWTRRVKRDGARYFGPFPSASSARQVLELLNQTFLLRDCSDNTFRHRSRPCILYQMGKCSAPCVQKISALDYKERMNDVAQVLEGKGTKLIVDLKTAMASAAEREDFELAAELRDQMQALDLVTGTQVVSEAGSVRNRDVLAIARAEVEGHAVVLQIRGGRLVAVRHYLLQGSDPSIPEPELIDDFLTQYYVGTGAVTQEPEIHAEADPLQSAATQTRPSEVLVSVSPLEPDLLERTTGIGVRVPETEADRQLLNVALANARHGLEQAVKKAQGHGMAALEEVMEKLQLDRLPHRIECFDISNTQGDESVASRVTFIDGTPDKNLYRRYKIKTVEGANDFASMKEVLGRRFSNDEDLPDLVVVDGGKGQLSQATAILEELGVQGVGVVGLAKARTESNFRSSEVKSSMERIFIPGRVNPVKLYPTTGAYKLLVHVRDEAHRFAISYHRLLRSKKSLQTDLSD